MAGMVCAGAIVVWIKRIVPQSRLSNGIHGRNGPLSFTAILARAGDANLWLPSLVPGDCHIDPFCGRAGTVYGLVCNGPHQPGSKTVALLFDSITGVDICGVYSWNYFFRFSLGVVGIFPV